MKSAVIIPALALGLLFAASRPAKAQHGNHDDHHASPQRQHEDDHARGHSSAPHQDMRPDRHEDRREASRPEARHEEHVHQQRSAERRPEQPHYVQESRPPHAEVRHVDRVQERDVWQRDRADHWRSEHRSWHERGGYHGYRIPEDRFRAHFGRAHWFRVRSVPIIVVNSHPRFQYAGLWFSLVDPWPETWARTWYETDDVCIDYVNDGYYLYNRSHPGIAIAVNVSF
jgi:hypothetical protein